MNDGPSDANAGAAGVRRIEYLAVEPSAFIGRWFEATGSFESLRPRVARPPVVPPPSTVPTASTIACDIVIAVAALLMIFCIPGLIIYAAMGH
jgi:hypothetical protein